MVYEHVEEFNGKFSLYNLFDTKQIFMENIILGSLNL